MAGPSIPRSGEAANSNDPVNVSPTDIAAIFAWCTRRDIGWWAESFVADDGTVAVGIGTPWSDGDFDWIIDSTRLKFAVVSAKSGVALGSFDDVHLALTAIERTA